MAYCPLKMMVRFYKRSASEFFVPGSYNAEDKCDESACGFWSSTNNMCGIAAMGSAGMLQPVPPDKKEESGDVINPMVKA